MSNDERPCRVTHTIGGHVPQSTDVHLGGLVCDCGRMIGVLVPCGCQNNPYDDLKLEPNPNYTG